MIPPRLGATVGRPARARSVRMGDDGDPTVRAGATGDGLLTFPSGLPQTPGASWGDPYPARE